VSSFDTIDHKWLLKFVEHRVADRRILRLIQKWLKAGVLEDGQWQATVEGTPQGATASPLLANIYLHYAFDRWIQRWRKRHARGDVIVVRFADDIIVGFQHRSDAIRCRKELEERLRKFSLELHPKKTRLLEFGRFAVQNRQERGCGKPETFNFLGFTHICARTRKGKFLLRRQTMRQRLKAKLREVRDELMRRRHQPIPEQGSWLDSVIRGHFAYYAVPTNTPALGAFRTQIRRHWLFALRRRSQHDRTTWTRMSKLSQRWLPPVRVQHPWPTERLVVTTQGRSPVR
jgi:group II intron reverse transcriptase/maturase